MITNILKIVTLFCLVLMLVGCSSKVDLPETEGGFFFADGIFFAKGIPYAEPPVGDLRWRPPVDMVFDEKLHLYSEFGASCFANKKKPFSSVLSEDCLYLNVWSPDLGGKLPVMVWIHGGGLSNGHGNVAGELLAEKGVVVVSLNYRLGPLGFFAHPELETNDPNFGFQDQISALRWVARNIKRFGGDPERVTIFGNSAGALSVDILTTHPEAGGLFRRAVAQSSYIGWQRHFMQKLHDDTKTDFSGRKLGIAEDQAISFVTGAGIDSGTSLGKLRQQDPTLFTNQQKVQILPIVDDDAFKVDHFGCVRDEKCGNQIDAYMTGFTSFEGQWLSRRWLVDDKNQEWIRNNWEKIRVVYRDDVQKRVELAHARFIGDMMFLNSSHLSAVANFQNGTKVYTYYTDAGIVFENGDKIGTPHGADSNIFWTQEYDDKNWDKLRKHYYENLVNFAHGRDLVGNGHWKAWSDDAQYWQVLGDDGDNAMPVMRDRLRLTEYFYNRTH